MATLIRPQTEKTERRLMQPCTSENEHVDVMFKLKSTCTMNIHSYIAQQQPHSSRPVFSTTVWPQIVREWIWNVSCPDHEYTTHQGYVQTHPSVEEFGHSLKTTGTNRQAGRGETSLCYKIRTSNDFITQSFSKGWSCWGVTPDSWLCFDSNQWGNRPLTPAICPPANISWVWGNTLCWTEVGRALESSDLDYWRWSKERGLEEVFLQA